MISQPSQARELTILGDNPTLYLTRTGGLSGTLLLKDGRRIEVKTTHKIESLSEANIIMQCRNMILPEETLKVEGCISLKAIPKEYYDRIDDEEIRASIHANINGSIIL